MLWEFQQLHASGVFAYEKGDTWIPVGMRFTLSVPIDVTLEISEMIYNLKVSLDYLIYALFKRASASGRLHDLVRTGVIKDLDRLEKTIDFPIMDSPEKFEMWRTSKGQWLREDESALIERAQPYRSNLIRYLGDLYHNLDKHRDLQPLKAHFDLRGGTVTLIPWQSESDGLDAVAKGAPEHVGVYRGGSVEVAFDDGTPVVETLKILQSEVGALIDAFDLTFE